jgi:hypothetical protein
MSEPIGICIEIGGTLPVSLIEAFLEEVYTDIDNLNGPDSKEEIIELSNTDCIRYDGTANYGLCNELTKFCQEHNLQWIQHSEASGEYNADTAYWKPGMKEPESFRTDAENNAVLRADEIRPLVYLLRDLIIEGEATLPKYINEKDERVKELVVAGLKAKNGITHASRFVRKLDMLIGDLIPIDPEDVPNIIIDLGK